MPRERDEWPPRIKAVEREYACMRLGADRLLAQAAADPNILGAGIRLRDVGHAAENLKGTYLTRIFAEFETGLRRYWGTIRESHPRMEDLVDSVASRHKIPDDFRHDVHLVRNYRNSLVHEREEETPPVGIGEARSHLCKFFARLPPDWV